MGNNAIAYRPMHTLRYCKKKVELTIAPNFMNSYDLSFKIKVPFLNSQNSISFVSL